MDQFEDIKSLGRGAYAQVRLVRRKADDELLVVKKFHVALRDLTPKERTEIAQEIKVLAHLRHPNIVEFKENFVEGDFTHIIMEYATGGTLYKKIVNRDGELFPEDQIWEMFVQIVMALRYVHSRNILHRDLKSENIMLSGIDERVIKLGDFGIAKILGSQADMAATIVGTPHSLSPELVQGAGYDQKSDVWALGCVLSEMSALRKPFDASNMPAIIFNIMRNNPAPLPPQYSPELRDMVKLLLRANPADRPSLPELEAMPIVQDRITKWRMDYRQLEIERGLPPSSVTAALGALPSARPSLTGLSTISGTLTSSSTAATSARSGGVTMRSPTSAGAPEIAASPLMSPAHHRTKNTQAVQFEREMVAALEDLAREAETVSGQASAALQARLDELHKRLETGPSQVSGRVWEMLGRAWADCGPVGFNRAIVAYRRSISAKSGAASLVAMEQLGNLLVRRAQQVWAKARAGHADEALAEAQMLLEQGSKTILSKITGKQARGKPPTKTKRVSASASDGAVEASMDSGDLAASAEEEEPAWRQAAAALMYEGLAYIERMCSLGSTAERRSLLGSAYKRRAWTGLGQSRKEDLQQAAFNYAAAHEIETEDGHDNPSPYARLNQLTLELLAGNGTAEERARLLAGIKEAEDWGNVRKEEDPADVWLWVQVVDARCLRYLLGDEEVGREDVVNGYREQFAFGASQRVKSSVMDQLSFLEEVLQGRVEEVEAEAQEKAAHLAARARSTPGLPPGEAASRDDAPVVASAVPRRMSAADSEDSAPLITAAALMGAAAHDSASQSGGGARPLRRLSQLQSMPETAALMRVRAWLITILEKVRDLRRRLEKHVEAEAAAAAAAMRPAVDTAAMIATANELAAAASVRTAASATTAATTPAGTGGAQKSPELFSPRAAAAFGYTNAPGPGHSGADAASSQPPVRVEVLPTHLAAEATAAATGIDAGKDSPPERDGSTSARRGHTGISSPSGGGPNPFARKSVHRFESKRRRSSTGLPPVASPTSSGTQSVVTPSGSRADVVTPDSMPPSERPVLAAGLSSGPPTSPAGLHRQPSASKLGSPNPFAKSTPSQARFRQTRKHLPGASPIASAGSTPMRFHGTPPMTAAVSDDHVTVVGTAAQAPQTPSREDGIRPGSRTRQIAPLPQQDMPYVPSAIVSPTPLGGRLVDPFANTSPQSAASSSTAGVSSLALGQQTAGASQRLADSASVAVYGSAEARDRARTAVPRHGSTNMTFDTPARDGDLDSAAAGLVMRAADLLQGSSTPGSTSNTMKSTGSGNGRDTRRFNAPPALVLTTETSNLMGSAGARGNGTVAGATTAASAVGVSSGSVTAPDARVEGGHRAALAALAEALPASAGFPPAASASVGDLSARGALDTPDRSTSTMEHAVHSAFPIGGATAMRRAAEDIATPSGVKANVMPSVRGPWGSNRSVDQGAPGGPAAVGPAHAKAPSPGADGQGSGFSGVLSTPNGGLALGYPSRRGSSAMPSPVLQAHSGSDVVSNMFTNTAMGHMEPAGVPLAVPSGSNSSRGAPSARDAPAAEPTASGRRAGDQFVDPAKAKREPGTGVAQTKPDVAAAQTGPAHGAGWHSRTNKVGTSDTAASPEQGPPLVGIRKRFFCC